MLSFQSCLCTDGDSSPRSRNRDTRRIGQESSEVSIIEQTTPATILVSDASLDDFYHSLPKTPNDGKKSVRIEGPECADDDGGEMSDCISGPSCAEDSRDVEEPSINSEARSKSADVSENKRAAKSLPLCKIIQESNASSVADTASSSWDAPARAHHYRHKLISTLQVLANKEETVRVQGESLRVAEARIASLSARAQRLRAELDGKAHELRKLRSSADRCSPEKVDASVTADAQDAVNQKNVVVTLQTNLSVIEDLYRECFYETAKQEELIEMLRRSYLDVRLMDKDKRDQMGRLQSVVDRQRWSLEQCQDMAVEVEGLKMDISNFLSSSNNDSGMWERSEDSLNGEVLGDLQQITSQLLQLRTMLSGDCTCGLQEENMRLKEENETMQIQVGELSQRVGELEVALSNKENGDQSYRDKLEEKSQELANVRRQLAELEENVGDRSSTYDTLATQLRQAQVSIEEQTQELTAARRRCQAHEVTINQLNEALEKANRITAEGRSLREELNGMKRAVVESSRRVRRLADELTLANQHCRSLDDSYREKAACAATLQAQLEQAHARGAALCGEVRGVVAGVQRWARRTRDALRQQEIKIKEQEALIKTLQQEQNGRNLTDVITDPCCSKCLSVRSRRNRSRASEAACCGCAANGERREIHRAISENNMNCCKFTTEVREARNVCRKYRSERGSCNCSSKITERHLNPDKSGMRPCDCPSHDRVRGLDGTKMSAFEIKEFKQEPKSGVGLEIHSRTSGSEAASFQCSRQGERREDRIRTSESEIASCSTAPTPPRRLMRKKVSSCEDKSWWGARGTRDAASAPCERDSCRQFHVEHVDVTRLPREASPSAELQQRMAALQAALPRLQARWGRPAT